MNILKIVFAAFLLFPAMSSATLKGHECLDWEGICNAIVFVETTYPRPDVQVGIAVSINAYNEERMEKIVALVTQDFISNGLRPWTNFSFSGNLPERFPGRPELKVHDFRRSYLCEGINGCPSAPGKYLDAFSMGYRRDDLNQTDADAVRRYVRDETGGRLNATLSKVCADFDKTCQPLTLTTFTPPPVLTTLPVVQPNAGAIVGIVVAATVAIVAIGAGVYIIVFKYKSRLFEQGDSELQPLRPSGTRM